MPHQAQSSWVRKFFKRMSASKSTLTSSSIPLESYGHHTYLHQPGNPVWSGRNYQRFSQEGYIRNVIAYRSIRMVATSAASVPWKVSSREGVLQFHPLLSILQNPNPSSSGSVMLEKVYTHKLISGNAYLQMLCPDKKEPRELHALRPDRMTIIAGNGGIPQGYLYKVGDKETRYPVHPISGRSDILHWKDVHPLDDWYGLSAVEAAAYAIDQHNQAAAWNQSLLQNGARPSGAVIVKGGGKKRVRVTFLRSNISA